MPAVAERHAPKGKLDLAAVPDLHGWLVAARDKEVILDLQDVTLFGTLCLQTCLAAARNAAVAGTGFAIINASDAVLAQLSAMGFTPESLSEGAA